MFADLLAEWGPPPLWDRPATFGTLVHIVMEQKISLASAKAVMARVAALCEPLTPEGFLALDEAPLRQAGVSGAKIGYCRSIADAVCRGDLPLEKLGGMDDADVTKRLVGVRGIGPWTAGVYLTMALRRPDAWPPGDRALAVGVAEAWRLEAVPDYASLDRMAEAWRPSRGAASRLIWHAYLERRAAAKGRKGR